MQTEQGPKILLKNKKEKLYTAEITEGLKTDKKLEFLPNLMKKEKSYYKSISDLSKDAVLSAYN